MFHKMEHLTLAGDRAHLIPLEIIPFLYEEGLAKKKKKNSVVGTDFTKKMNCVCTASSNKRLPWRLF